MLDHGLPHDRRSYGLLRGRFEFDRARDDDIDLQLADRRLRIR